MIGTRSKIELLLRLQIPDEKVTIISKRLKSRPSDREPICSWYRTLRNSKACSLPFSLDLCLPDQAIESVPFQSQRAGRNMFPVIEPKRSIDQDQDPKEEDRRGLFVWIWWLIDQKVLQSSHQVQRDRDRLLQFFSPICVDLLLDRHYPSTLQVWRSHDQPPADPAHRVLEARDHCWTTAFLTEV